MALEAENASRMCCFVESSSPQASAATGRRRSSPRAACQRAGGARSARQRAAHHLAQDGPAAPELLRPPDRLPGVRQKDCPYADDVAVHAPMFVPDQHAMCKRPRSYKNITTDSTPPAYWPRQPPPVRTASNVLLRCKGMSDETSSYREITRFPSVVPVQRRRVVRHERWHGKPDLKLDQEPTQNHRGGHTDC